ncbi:MAG TPA: hypothetical protein VNG53_11235, partial [Bacteroidia bacterium]|nr:hypothetical protein [Bacteroidia bacterium]
QNNNISYGGFSVPSKINITEEQKKEAINIVNKKNTLYQEWGWKDPRTCLFIDFWNSIIPNSKILILFRDYDDVVSSLINRDLKTIYIKKTLYEKLFRNDKKIINQLKELYFNSWIEYNQRILNFIKTKDSNNILVLSFSDLAKNIKPLFTYINEVWNFSSLEINQEKIVSFDKSLLSSKKHYGFKQSKKIELANSIFLELEKQSLDSLKKLKK